MKYFRFNPIALIMAIGVAASAASLKPSETRFVEETLNGGRHEVEMARMALTQGADGEVKSFAQRLVNDHSAVNTKLEQIAKANNVSTTAAAKADDNHLAGLRGADFDKAFVQEMLEKHRAGVAKFEAAEKDATNPELHSLIASTLPTLREHLKQAESLSKKK
jgi:putative membrane protein